MNREEIKFHSPRITAHVVGTALAGSSMTSDYYFLLWNSGRDPYAAPDKEDSSILIVRLSPVPLRERSSRQTADYKKINRDHKPKANTESCLSCFVLKTTNSGTLRPVQHFVAALGDYFLPQPLSPSAPSSSCASVSNNLFMQCYSLLAPRVTLNIHANHPCTNK